ncbi:hypothetical protein QE429_000461 [Bacillus sp. SORGH_AS 510]|nr:hypothetical protein [Bacillus sp. SORGH_AS_0510]
MAGKLEILSEVEGSLDRVGEKTRNIVRSRGKFGQSWWENKKHCQKSREVWTELVGKQETLSEVVATLDRVGGKTRNTVRSRGKFGQSIL